LPTRTPGVEHIDCRRLWHARVSDYYREFSGEGRGRN
jgi:hypothetical protein